jgi:hypothetical protein
LKENDGRSEAGPLRTHLSLNKDTPIHRAAQSTGPILAIPMLGGLHHHYVRI